MKVYDKEIYSKQESLRTIVVIIVVFLLGFFAGYMAKSFNETHKPDIRIRFSMNNLNKDDNLINIPLFMAEYVKKFIETQ